jgi:hypothetical protein
MLKTVFLAAAASLVLAGAATTVPVQPAQAKAYMKTGVTCRDAAKMRYPADRKARHAYKKACKERYKAWKKAHKHGFMLRRR